MFSGVNLLRFLPRKCVFMKMSCHDQFMACFVYWTVIVGKHTFVIGKKVKILTLWLESAKQMSEHHSASVHRNKTVIVAAQTDLFTPLVCKLPPIMWPVVESICCISTSLHTTQMYDCGSSSQFPEMDSIAREQKQTSTKIIFFLIQNAGLLSGFTIILMITMFAGHINLGWRDRETGCFSFRSAGKAGKSK